MSEKIVNYDINHKLLIVNMPEKVDISNSQKILSEIMNYFNVERINKIVFEMKDCDFISSAGIGLMANVAKQSKDRNIQTSVRNCNENIKEVLTITDIINYIGLE